MDGSSAANGWILDAGLHTEEPFQVQSLVSGIFKREREKLIGNIGCIFVFLVLLRSGCLVSGMLMEKYGVDLCYGWR